MTNIETVFWSADKAYEYFYKTIKEHGCDFADTKALFNVGFTILEPKARIITSAKRDWKHKYAEAEWQWYLSGNRNISKLGEIYGKTPEIWKRMANANGDVNSNYGWQWKRNNQIDYVIDLLKRQPDTRQAVITILDMKEHDTFTFDTPCTYAIQFTIVKNRLNMCVTMRSNDLWYGFCNDQYQFSKLQEMMSNELEIEIGTYYHFAHNLHLYNDKI
jgi:thymidylate synthase|tara:strand:+ start:162 stop:812 length:651 start_codon:yes stop_codon:yes gene_type:complete